MTRVALPVWEGRISPVFDVARRLLFVDLDGARELGRTMHLLAAGEPDARVRMLTTYDTEVLVCGAISRPVADLLAAHGIRVMDGIRGDVEQVLRAFQHGALERDATWHLPGTFPRTAHPHRAGRRRTGGSRQRGG